MSEYIVNTFGIVQDFADLYDDMNTPLYQAIMDVMVSRQREEIVRCRDCKYAHPVFWQARDDVSNDWLDCTGPLVTTWDYYNDEPKDNPVRPDGFCAWGAKVVD